MLKGQIKADSLNEALINIVNFSQKTGTTNSASGAFVIKVREQDTLIFSSVQYEVVEVIISAEIIQKEFLEVRLVEKFNQLTEVHLSDINLSGNLGKDVAEMKIFNQAQLGFPFRDEPPPSGVSRKIGVASSSPLILLINTLNGRLKMLKKAQEVMKFDDMVHRGLSAVPMEFFTAELQIPESEIMNFVYFCAEKPLFKALLSKEQHLELIEYYFENAPAFLEQMKK